MNCVCTKLLRRSCQLPEPSIQNGIWPTQSTALLSLHSLSKSPTSTRYFHSNWNKRPWNVFQNMASNPLKELNYAKLYSTLKNASSESKSTSSTKTATDLMTRTGGLFQRVSGKFKYFLTGYHPRPFKADDFLAFGSWLFMGHSLFVFLATTTFVSLIVWLVNTLEFQGELIRVFI